MQAAPLCADIRQRQEALQRGLSARGLPPALTPFLGGGPAEETDQALDALSADVDYKTRLVELKDYVDRANAYAPWIAEFKAAVKDAPDRQTFDMAKDDYKSSKTGMAMRRLYGRTSYQDELTGKCETAYGIAVRLADMIVGSNNKAGVHECDNHMQVPSGVFTKTVDQLNNPPGFTCGYIDPGLYHVALVVGEETEFMKHTITLLSVINFWETVVTGSACCCGIRYPDPSDSWHRSDARPRHRSAGA